MGPILTAPQPTWAQCPFSTVKSHVLHGDLGGASNLESDKYHQQMYVMLEKQACL